MTKRQTRYLIIAAIVISIGIIYAISYASIISPLQTELNSVEQQADMFEARYDSVAGQSADGDIDDELREITTKVPAHKSPDRVLHQLQALAAAANVVITSVSSTDSPIEDGEGDEPSLQGTSYTVEASGESLEQANMFLDSILDSERLMVIDTMSVYQTDSSVSLSLEITTYHSEN